MIAILFWNTYGGAVGSMVQYLCAAHNVDVVVLAEEPRLAQDVFPVSGGSLAHFFDEYAPGLSKIRFFVRRGAGKLKLVSDNGNRQSLREFHPSTGTPILLAGVHLPSKLRAKEGDQYLAARQLRRAVEDAERLLGHDATVLIGDMNMSPYEAGMSAADGLHGVMDKRIAQKRQRILGGQAFTYFYNPMWSRLGDESVGPTGTYYRSADGVNSTFWHTFDQALIRPSLIPAYTRGSLEVLMHAGGAPLATATRVSPSDHLPILLRLDI